MIQLTDNIWNLFSREYTKYYRKNSMLLLHSDKEDKFKTIFKKHYKHIMETYMADTVKNLDRHKVAAIIIISLIEVYPLEINELDDKYIFVGNELIALKTGLAYMLKEINEKFIEKKADYKLKEFIFPEAQSCNTSYMDIMCRNLYYSNKHYVLNPLDLADRLFLIEYITLLNLKINPNILKD